MVFALVFGLAATRISAEKRASLFGFFDAVKDAMMTLVHWVLWAAPFGVFALALVTGARTGLGPSASWATTSSSSRSCA
uniref:Cation:dicarboxylase symporter family transporter n=1 Tax=Phenylobacterium glaciei TaxID=2803784 RepID=A0A974P3F9_9CAUL|nr:cation:dicarboxylase symporter family transporter [Phenylobacterium glaciei]